MPCTRLQRQRPHSRGAWSTQVFQTSRRVGRSNGRILLPLRPGSPKHQVLHALWSVQIPQRRLLAETGIDGTRQDWRPNGNRGRRAVERWSIDILIRYWLTKDPTLSSHASWNSRVCPECVLNQHTAGMLLGTT